MASGGSSSVGKKKKEIWTYEAPWAVYGLAGSMRPGAEFANRFAIGSYIEEYCNKVQARRREYLLLQSTMAACMGEGRVMGDAVSGDS